jgi:hypothetical protein
MTASDVRKRVEAIKALGHDYEAQHSETDKLHIEVLRWFAEQGYALAIAALETEKLDFPRYCA